MLGPDGQPAAVYGVNTGFGSLARVRIPEARAGELSMNLIRSHAAGVGEPLDTEVVRAAMLLRANALACGRSGCEPRIVATLLAMLARGVTPEVPSRGSCGSSGDLAPLSHLGLVVFEGPEDASGWAWFGGERLRGAEAMWRAGIHRVPIGPKDALAMTNGAQVTTALAALALFDADRLVRSAEVAAALTFEALQGVTHALDPRVIALRPHRGAVEVASALRRLLAGSTCVDATDGVQDAYSLRCAPQVMGAVRDAVRASATPIDVELNAVTDNPVFLTNDAGGIDVRSAGLFHGEPVGFAADHLRLGLAELAAIAERRVARLTTALLHGDLPALLSPKGGLGLLMVQPTAAALVNALRQSAWPASADSSPTCEDQEDHVAMSTTAALKAREAIAHARHVVAIEWLTASAGARFRLAHGGTLGAGTAAGLADVGGGTLSQQIGALSDRIADGSWLGRVDGAVGRWDGPLDA